MVELLLVWFALHNVFMQHYTHCHTTMHIVLHCCVMLCWSCRCMVDYVDLQPMIYFSSQ